MKDDVEGLAEGKHAELRPAKDSRWHRIAQWAINAPQAFGLSRAIEVSESSTGRGEIAIQHGELAEEN